MVKGCKHISCLSITKLARRIEDDGITKSTTESDNLWICAICLQAFPTNTVALPHGRKHNHQIFFSTESNGFYCAICSKDVDETTLSGKMKAVLQDASVLIVEGLKRESKRTISKNDEEITSDDEVEELRRPSGLVNLGNTCFFNSALQAICAVLLEHSVDSMPDLGPIGTSLWATLQSIPITMNRTNLFKNSGKAGRHGTIVDPSPLLGAIGKRYKEFKRLRQQDSHDFIRLLFNALEDEHKPERPKRALHQELFEGVLVSRVKCKACKNVTEVEEAFLDLSLPISIEQDEVEDLSKMMQSLSTIDIRSEEEDQRDGPSIKNLLLVWGKPVLLEDENAFACENCPKLSSSEPIDAKFIYQPATQQFLLKSLPPCLIFHIQRFHVSSVGKRGIKLSKDHTHINIPLNISLSEMKDGHHMINYRLSALVIHEGSSVDSGHYVAVVRYGNDWWYASDASVRKISSPQGYNPYLVIYSRQP